VIENLTDIEALVGHCHSEQSKSYISEAIQCYQAGAYRAAIVSAWIAVVFDLIDKIRELAVSGDSSAKSLEANYETYIFQIEQNNPQGIKKALEFEREILETCRDNLQLFDPQQFVDLIRLREDRHRCAHPSFQRTGVPYHPPAEQARLHIRNAVIHVLSAAPVQGKAALAQLKALVSSSYFPTDLQNAISHLRSSSLKNGTAALINGFIDLLVFGFLTKNDTLFYKAQVYAALNATSEMYPAQIEERLRKQLNKLLIDISDTEFSGACALVVNTNIAWRVLETPSKTKISRFIEVGPSTEVIGGLEILSKLDGLLPIVERRITNLTFDELSEAINRYELREPAKSRSLQILSEVRSWDSANAAFEKIILPIFDCLSAQDIGKIICMPIESGADLPGAHGYGLFIKKVREKNIFDETTLNALLIANNATYLTRTE
jgi:hypothetical protein